MTTIKGISIEDNRSIYVLNKKQIFWKQAKKMLIDFKISFGDLFGSADEEGKKEININKLKDWRAGFSIDKDSFVDFIIGDKKIFIIFSYKKDMQNKFSKAIKKYFGR